jgi:hypothetical protein
MMGCYDVVMCLDAEEGTNPKPNAEIRRKFAGIPKAEFRNPKEIRKKSERNPKEIRIVPFARFRKWSRVLGA